jgi:histone acetyltransferase MYST1
MEVRVGSRVLCRWKDGEFYPAEVIQERFMPSHQFYVHYIEFNKRLDDWVDLRDIKALPPNSDQPSSMVTRFHKRRREELHPSETIEDVCNPTLAHLEKEHEEYTKIRNIEKVILGRYEIQPWYYSPYLPKYPHLNKLYVCEFCLKYMRHSRTYIEHTKKCKRSKPPGKLIYRDKVTISKIKTVSVYEIQGNEDKLYCQNFCLLAKLFLDHKTLYYFVSPFKFYVLTEDNGRHSRIVGYFSKEIGNDDYNLACILILPPYQQKGYGRFLIALSYELSKREGKIGTPERPLSDMGRVSYKSYWTDAILELLMQKSNLTVKEITEETGISQHDVIETLTSLNLVKYWKGQYIVNSVNSKQIEEHFKKKKERKKKLKGQFVTFNPKKLSY